MNRSSPFIVLTTQRSGSSWFIEMLDSHPRVAAYGELFLPAGRGQPAWGRGDVVFFSSFAKNKERGALGSRRPVRTVSYLRELLESAGSVDAVGFKLMYSEARRFPEILLYSAARRIRLIHLVRTNHLDVIASREAMRTRGLQHAWRHGDGIQVAAKGAAQSVAVMTDADSGATSFEGTGSTPKVVLGPGALVRDLAGLDRRVRFARAWLRFSRTPTLEVHYEDVVRRPSAFGEVLRFLGVRAAPDEVLHSAMTKINAPGQRDVIQNYDEVARRLEGTRFEGLLRP